MGFFGLSQSLSMSLTPLFGGVLLDAFPRKPWFIRSTISAVAFIAAAGFRLWGTRARVGPSGEYLPADSQGKP
jgi:hypothetical protein